MVSTVKLRHVLLGLAGSASALFGAVMCLGFLLMQLDGKKSLVENLAAGIFLGLVPLGLGLLMVIYALRRRTQLRAERDERMILDLAQRNGGELTVSQVAVSTALASAEAKRMLDRCHSDGLAQIRVNEGGEVVYHFFGSIGS